MTRRTAALLTVGLVGFLLMLSVARSRAQTASDTGTMAVANQLYENGRFAEAAQTYQQLVDQGVRDSTLYYNLGNAYFKTGDVGRAILNYQRAARLAPRDADIQVNLALARAQTIDQYERGNESAVARLATFARSWLTLNEMAFLALGLWALLALLFLLYRRQSGRLREGLQYTLILVALLLVGGLFSLGSRLYVENVRPAGVIVAGEANVMSGPGEQYITEFDLHSGAEVGLIERRTNWVRLALPGDQLQGWVPAEAVAPVVETDR